MQIWICLVVWCYVKGKKYLQQSVVRTKTLQIDWLLVHRISCFGCSPGQESRVGFDTELNQKLYIAHYVAILRMYLFEFEAHNVECKANLRHYNSSCGGKRCLSEQNNNSGYVCVVTLDLHPVHSSKKRQLSNWDSIKKVCLH